MKGITNDRNGVRDVAADKLAGDENKGDDNNNN